MVWMLILKTIVSFLSKKIFQTKTRCFFIFKISNQCFFYFKPLVDTDDNDAPIDDEISSDDGSGESSGDDGSGFIDSSIIENEHNKNPIYQHNANPATNHSSSINSDIHFDSTESTTIITTTTMMTKIITLDITKTAGSFGHYNNRPNINLQLLIIAISLLSSTILQYHQ